MHKYSPIAIISKAFHFPQYIQSDKTFWEVLKNKKCVITHIPQDRWPTQELLHSTRTEAGRSVTYAAGVIADVENFDAAFFGISPREAAKIDPQQRLLLMLTQEVFENAGIPASNFEGSNCGVFIGISSLDYGMQHLEDLSSMTLHSMTGNTMSVAANRISYIYNLHGPSLAIDTACSSSLVALHTACKAIQNGEISCALVGGVNLLYHPYSFIGFSKASMISAEGSCFSFDAKGTGYVRAEGAAMLLIKSLDDALAQGDRIEAVIRGSGVNTDGRRKTSITIPSAAGQIELMSTVLNQSNISPEHIDFIEMHGTGTPVGDPIEAQAVAAVYGQKRSTPLPISSVKANMGHMEPASGMAGLMKALLVMKNRQIPPAPFDFEPNPHIDFDGLNIRYIANSNAYKLKENGVLHAAVNSFGFGGVNAHIILQSADNLMQPLAHSASSACKGAPLFLSARSKKSLEKLAGNYATFLQEAKNTDLYNIAYSAATQRDFFEKRVAFVAQDTDKLIQNLQDYAQGATCNDINGICVEQSPIQETGSIAFVYCGNGSHWHGMAQTLLHDPDFAQCIKEIDALTQKYSQLSVWQQLQESTPESLDNTAITQPLIFAIQVGITHLLQKQGITPYAVTGHSVGEVVAAYIAGAYDLAQAVQIICARSQCQALTAGSGRMAAIKLRPEHATQLIQDLHMVEHVFLAGINAPEHLTLSGSKQHLEVMQQYAQQKGIYFQFLPLNYAFHSPHMDEIQDRLLEKLQNITHAPRVKAHFVSSVTGTSLENKDLDAHYWWKNVRMPVLFAPAIDTLMDLGVRTFVEIGPHAILQRYIKDCIKEKNMECLVLPTLLRNNDHPQRILEAALQIRLAAPKPQIQDFFPHVGTHVMLPNYAWHMEHYGLQPTIEHAPFKRRIHPLLGWSLDGVEKMWENVLDPRLLPWLAHHMVGEAMVFPAAGYVEIALAAGKALFGQSPYAIEYLDIVAPLVFEENVAQVVRTSFEAGIFKIVARPRMSDGPWLLYATGRIKTEKNTSLPLDIPQNIATTSAQSTLYTPTALYTKAQGLGLVYGEYFQTLQDLHVYPQDLYANIHSDQNIWQEYHLAPAELDTCFHALVALIDIQQDKAARAMAYLPVKTGAIMVVQEAPAARIAVHIKRISSRSILADCALYAADGSLIAFALQCRFRAAPLTHKLSSHIHTWQIRGYNKELGRKQAIALPSIEAIIQNWPTKTCSNYGEQRKKWFEQTLPLLEMLSLAYGIESLDALQKENSAAFQQAIQKPYGRWLIQLLEEQDLANAMGEHWQFASQDVPPSQELWQEILSLSPESMAQILPMGRIALHLQEALTHFEQQEELFHTCYASPVSKHLRAHSLETLPMAQAVAKIVQNFVAQAPQGHVIRILEVGAFSWGLAQRLYRTLPTDTFTYTFAGTEEESIQHMQHVLDTYENARSFSLSEDWGKLHDAPQGPFDIIIVQQSLHTWLNISPALDYLKKQLLPQGLLLATECYAHWHTHFIHGLRSTWWRPQGQSSLLNPAQWQALFTEKGFINVTYKNENYAEDLQAGAYVLLAQKPTEYVDEQTASVDLHNNVVLLLGDDFAAPLLTPLYQELCNQSIKTQKYFGQENDRYISEIEKFLQDIPQAKEEESIRATIILSLGNGQEIPQMVPQLESLRQVLCFLGKNSLPQLRLIVLTQGAALCPKTPTLHNPVSAALWGMGRTGMNEFPELSCTLMDIADIFSLSEQSQTMLGEKFLSKLMQEIQNPDGADEILLTEDSRQVLMLQADNAEQQAVTHKNSRFRLDVIQPGKLNHLRWFEDQACPLQAQQVEVQVMATGLNFRDVMLTLGLLPDDAVENGFAGPTLGLEFSGKITRLGNAVSQFSVGDAVVGFAPSCFSSHVITDADVLAPMPRQWRFEDAASVPTVFFTAYYALKHLAHMQAGETLLIHGAAGGVGLAAIQIAKHLGVEIFATAGSDEKRAFLQLQGVKHIFDSRSLDFATQIYNVTHGKGVDVVLNSLAGEAMRRSIDLLSPFGRFIELGKRDFVENTPINLRPFKENISYFAFDADQMLTAKPAISKKVFHEIMALFEQNIFHVLPVRTFAAEQIVDAFRAMQQAQHIGKLVVSLRTPPKFCHKKSASPIWRSQGKETWLITGGLEGFGLATAKWLVERGVQSLVLVSRRGLESPEAQNIRTFFEEKNVQIRIGACQVGDAQAVQELIRSLQDMEPPLKGIIHAAAVYNDAFLSELTEETIAKVLMPKLQGAWNLHKASLTLPKERPLEHFVLFSSISAALGNMGQGNYVAANTGLESLALLRQSMGLKATCIAWGPIGDVGYLTTHEKVKQNLEKHLGTEVLTSHKALQALGHALMGEAPVQIVANLDWQALKLALPHAATRYTQIFHKTQSTYGHQSDGHSPQNIRATLSTMSHSDAMDTICEILTQEIAQVLSLDPQNIERSVTLQALGMDSLMAVELALGLEQRVGILLPTMLLQDAPTIEKVASRLMDKLFAADKEQSKADSWEDLQRLAQKHGESFSDEEMHNIKNMQE